MDATTYTKGPWKVYEEIDGDVEITDDQEAEAGIRDLAILADDAGEATIAHVELTNTVVRTARADARLIAAAPEMLAIVQWCKTHLEDDVDWGMPLSDPDHGFHEDYKRIVAVLKKVKGA